MMIDHEFQWKKSQTMFRFPERDFKESQIFSALVEFEMIPKSAASQCRQVELGMKRLVLSSKNGNLPDEQGVAQRVQAAVAAFDFETAVFNGCFKDQIG